MKVVEQLDLTNYNAFRLNAKCERAFFPESEDELKELLQSLKSAVHIIGSGNNIILSKSYYDTPFILLRENFSKIQIINKNRIKAQSGALLNDLANFAMLKELSGLEVFSDIPSSVGGAVVMNAGASGDQIANHIAEITVLMTDDLSVIGGTPSNFNYGYRQSDFQINNKMIVLGATFQLEKSDKAEIINKTKKFKDERWKKQPRNWPNAGSVFKRPEGYFVGKLIEEAGLKGFSIGGAQISEKHAGFIINLGNAHGEDILELIEYIKLTILQETGIALELEQRII